MVQDRGSLENEEAIPKYVNDIFECPCLLETSSEKSLQNVEDPEGKPVRSNKC